MSEASKFFDAHPPTLSPERLAEIAENHFGITGNITPLWGERDQNVLIERDGANDVVLKITNEREHPETVDLHISTLRHLEKTGADIPVARIVPALDGRDVVDVAAPDGTKHQAYVCTRLPGATLEEVLGERFDAAAFRAVGQLAGRTASALQGFFHPAAGAPLFWDARQMGGLFDNAAGIRDEKLRDAALKIGRELAENLAPALLSMRSQVIHHDVNRANVLFDPAVPDAPTGLIDFGDMLHGTLVQDVAVCASEMAFGCTDVLAVVCEVVAGYDSALELRMEEIDLLWDLMVARTVSGLMIGGARQLNGIRSPNDLSYEAQYGPVFEQLMAVGRDRTRDALRHACRFPEYCPPEGLASDAGQNATVAPDLLARRHAVMGHRALLSYDKPLHIVRGEGVWLFDAAGQRHLDAYNNVPHVGHCHPHVVRAQARQARTLNTNTRYVYESVIEYGERLAALMPGDLSVTLFVNSGSEANDVAQRMARKLTGHDGSLIVDGAYHGITSEIYALSPSMVWSGGEEAIQQHPIYSRPDIGVLPVPDLLRAKDPAATLETQKAEARAIIDRMEASGHHPAMFLFCSALSSSGILDLPPDYIGDLAAEVQRRGGMIVCDEVQYGFGRSGETFWGFQNYGVTADAVTLGKPMANGLATGAVVTTPDNVERFTRDAEFFSTFGGNPVACAAANAVLDVIERENLRENAKTVGDHMRAGLRDVIKSVPGADNIVAEVRGRGLFTGVEIVRDRETLTPDGDLCSTIKNRLREKHVLVGSDGFYGNVLKIRPPMVINQAQANILVAAFGETLDEVLRHS